MIKVKVTFQKDDIKAIHISGHAQSGEYGRDLVCAGVSAVVIGGLNALERHDDFNIEVADGLVSVKAKTLLQTHDQIVLETILTSLQTIQQNYRKYIKISQERTD